MSDKPSRSYFKYSIIQLEEEYVQGKSDSHTLHAIDHELNYRSTDRAAQLKRKVREALRLIQSQSGAQSNNLTSPGHVRQRGVNSGVLEVAIGQAALGGIWAGCASLGWVLSSAMASTCM